jgi:predicted GIY-YIG superfamily endonuclease
MLRSKELRMAQPLFIWNDIYSKIERSMPFEAISEVGRLFFMHYVYLLRSLKYPDQTYIGYTTNLKERIIKHNEGGSKHTSSCKPWKLVSYIAFSDRYKALSFEAYLKHGSGHAFAKKRLW